MTAESAWSRPEGAAGADVQSRLPYALERRLAAGEPAYRFGEMVKLNGLRTRVIDRAQERRLLEEGIGRFGLTLDEARGTLRTVAEDNNYVFEAETGQRIQQMLARDAGKKGRIPEHRFNHAADMLRDFSNGTVNAADARRQVKRIMVENGWRPARSGLFRTRGWFRQVDA